MSTVHVVYNGKNETLEFDQIFRPDWCERLNINTASLTNDQIKAALSNFYDVNSNEFNDHFIEINPNGNITVRPNATWG